jgi:hypothetical protein
MAGRKLVEFAAAEWIQGKIRKKCHPPDKIEPKKLSPNNFDILKQAAPRKGSLKFRVQGSGW